MSASGLEHNGVEANGSAIFAGCTRSPTATCGNNGSPATFACGATSRASARSMVTAVNSHSLLPHKE